MNDMHLVLHGVAIKKHATPEAVAGTVGLDVETVKAMLAQAAGEGRVTEAKGAYMLTPLARVSLGGDYSRVYADLRGDEDFVKAYNRFERINAELKQLMTDWQTMEVGGERVANDHSDKDHDAAIIDRLGALHERFEPVIDDMAARLPRLSLHKDKLTRALEKAEDGEIDWVSGARIESYHTVWFEMHEDLLRILGRERDE